MKNVQQIADSLRARANDVAELYQDQAIEKYLVEAADELEELHDNWCKVQRDIQAEIDTKGYYKPRAR